MPPIGADRSLAAAAPLPVTADTVTTSTTTGRTPSRTRIDPGRLGLKPVLHLQRDLDGVSDFVGEPIPFGFHPTKALEKNVTDMIFVLKNRGYKQFEGTTVSDSHWHGGHGVAGSLDTSRWQPEALRLWPLYYYGVHL